MNVGYVVDIDEFQTVFWPDCDRTTESGITGLQSSELSSLKRLSVSRRVCTALMKLDGAYLPLQTYLAYNSEQKFP